MFAFLRKKFDSGGSAAEGCDNSNVLTVPGISGMPDDLPAISQRAEALLAQGKRPEGMFVLCRDQPSKGLITFSADESGLYMLLFRTPFFAGDYMQATGVSAAPGFMSMDQLTTSADRWSAQGLSGFILNRCPRCDTTLLHKLETLRERENLLRVWAMDVEMRHWKRQQLVSLAAQAFNVTGQREQAIQYLELVRDHVDPGFPHVHYILGLLASFEGDQVLLETCRTRLRGFGAEWKTLLEPSPGDVMECMFLAGMLLAKAVSDQWDIVLPSSRQKSTLEG
jgi:hypothetical protein